MIKSYSQPHFTEKQSNEALANRAVHQTRNDTEVKIKTLPPQKNFEGTSPNRQKTSPVGVHEFPTLEDTTHTIHVDTGVTSVHNKGTFNEKTSTIMVDHSALDRNPDLESAKQEEIPRKTGTLQTKNHTPIPQLKREQSPPSNPSTSLLPKNDKASEKPRNFKVLRGILILCSLSNAMGTAMLGEKNGDKTDYEVLSHGALISFAVNFYGIKNLDFNKLIPKSVKQCGLNLFLIGAFTACNYLGITYASDSLNITYNTSFVLLFILKTAVNVYDGSFSKTQSLIHNASIALSTIVSAYTGLMFETEDLPFSLKKALEVSSFVTNFVLYFESFTGLLIEKNNSEVESAIKKPTPCIQLFLHLISAPSTYISQVYYAKNHVKDKAAALLPIPFSNPSTVALYTTARFIIVAPKLQRFFVEIITLMQFCLPSICFTKQNKQPEISSRFKNFFLAISLISSYVAWNLITATMNIGVKEFIRTDFPQLSNSTQDGISAPSLYPCLMSNAVFAARGFLEIIPIFYLLKSLCSNCLTNQPSSEKIKSGPDFHSLP